MFVHFQKDAQQHCDVTMLGALIVLVNDHNKEYNSKFLYQSIA